MKKIVTFFALLSVSVTALAQTDPGGRLADGVYVGYQIPDSVQDKTKGKCQMETLPKQALLYGGKALMHFNNGFATGEFDPQSHQYNLTAPLRGITLVQNGSELFGRMLVGSGPWCKFTLRLKRLPYAPVPPQSFNQQHNGLYTAGMASRCAGTSASSGDELALKIFNGVATVGFATRAWGFVDASSNATLVGNGVLMKLTKSAAGYSALIDDRGQAADAVADTPARPPCHEQIEFIQKQVW